MPSVVDLLEQGLGDTVMTSRLQPDAGSGEDRLLLSGFSWDRYLALDEELGDERPSPRLHFLDDTIQLVSTSQRHQEIKAWLASLLAQYFIARGIRAYPRGQATIKKLKDAGAEPDESWTFEERKDVPDLVLEIALTSGGLPKLEIYQRFGVREVWFWRKGALEVWILEGENYSGPHRQSSLLPDLPQAELERHALMEDWMPAMRSFAATVAA